MAPHTLEKTLLGGALLFTLGFFAFFGGGQEDEPQARPSVEELAGHQQMLDDLAARRVEVGDAHPYLGDRRLKRFEQALERAPADAPPAKLAEIQRKLGIQKLRLGDPQGAVRDLERGLEIQEELGTVTAQVRYDVALGWLRLGETQNCVARCSADNCLLPIRGEGVHVDQESSKRAIEHLSELLATAGEDEPLRLPARYLLNVGYMTVGGYPEEVPEEYLLPPSLFESSVEFPRFFDVAESLGLNTLNLAGGALTEDFDEDGDLDILTSTWDTAGPLHYFRNEGRNAGNGAFVDRTSEARLDGLWGGLNMCQADYDDDGAIDVLILRGAWVGSYGRTPNSLLRNVGDGTFVDATFRAGLDGRYPTSTAAWADYDRDGDLDVYIGNESDKNEPYPSELYQNDADGTFTEVAQAAGVENLRFAKGVAWGDVDMDGFPELYVSNFADPNRFYANRGDGTFTDVAEERGLTQPIDSFPTWFWDFDNDGALDLFVASYSLSGGANRLANFVLAYAEEGTPAVPPHLYRGDGQGGFEEVGRARGLWEISYTMGANCGDLDNDGFLDVYLGTGYPAFDGLVPNFMYRNRGGETFDNVTYAGGFGHVQKGHGIAFADLDDDGDQDVFEQMGGAFPGDAFRNALFENPGFGNHWLKVRLVGTQTNRSAIGARIRLVLTEDGKEREVYAHVRSGGSFGANPLTQHLGLGQGRVERLEVWWPQTGATQSFEDIPRDHHLTIVEGDDTPTVRAPTPVRWGN